MSVYTIPCISKDGKKIKLRVNFNELYLPMEDSSRRKYRTITYCTIHIMGTVLYYHGAAVFNPNDPNEETELGENQAFKRALRERWDEVYGNYYNSCVTPSRLADHWKRYSHQFRCKLHEARTEKLDDSNIYSTPF